ncbi:COG1470 family protein [Thermus filiformis]|uniref:COG1470 family protein n=1 Tax=Thermus filiformis TaxID=276 RepID=UPI001269E4B8|nr:Ig-like domain-containing protein [Thermus filiformis]
MPGVYNLSADLLVYEGSTLLERRVLTPANPSATLSLSPGRTYDFELSVKADPGDNQPKEVAWVRESRNITGDTTIPLRPRAIATGVMLVTYTPLREGKATEVELWIDTPIGPLPSKSFPLDDLGDPAYAVVSGSATVEAGSKLGARVAAAPGSAGTQVALRVSLQAMGSDHTLQTLTDELTLSVLNRLPSDDGQTFGGSVANLGPGVLPAPLEIHALSDSLGPWGTLQPDASFTIGLKPGADLEDHLAPLVFEPLSCTWTDTPEDTNFVPVDFEAGTYDLLLVNDPSLAYQPGYKMGALVYMDRPLSARGNCTDPYYGITYAFDFNLQAGWNIWVIEFTSSNSLSYSGTPFSGSTPSGLNWYLSPEPTPPGFTISLNPTSLTVQQGQSGTTTLTITPQNGFTGEVTLALERQDGTPAPSGITLSPTSVTVSGSSPVTQVLTLSVGAGVTTGTYNLRVKATSGSLVSTANLTLYVTSGGGGSGANVGVSADFSPPWGWISYPGWGESLPAGTPVNIRGWARDNQALASVEVYVNFQPLAGVVITQYAPGDWGWSVPWTPSTPGRNRIDLVVKDQGGNSYAYSIWVNVQQ